MTQATALAAEFSRRFVKPDADFGDWGVAQRYYRALAERPVDSAVELERWLFDWSELDSCFEEEGTRRYVDYTRQTDDPARERRYLDFLENIKPKREPWLHALRKRFLELAARYPLPPRRYDVLARSIANAIDIFREENIPLLTEDEKMRQQYQKIVGAMTCVWDGRELTLPQMGPFLEEPDRSLRERAWRAAADRFLADRDPLNDLYARMVAVRDRVARHAACSDYREYIFKRYERFDYRPADCLRFHEAIERVAVPAAALLAKERREKLGLDVLRPWDTDVDPDGRSPLRPFETDERLSDGCARIFGRVSPDFARIYDTMVRAGALDLGSRKGKAPGGYQETFHERRMPFIFMNAVGAEGDVSTLLHEGGHAFHTWSCRSDPLLAYRSYPTEFAEVASMGMEMLALPHLEEFYSAETGRARRNHLVEIVNFFPWMARVDAFQHFVYTHPHAGLERWLQEWVALQQRFSPHIDWSGLDECNRHSWHRKLHFFEAPFYYIEYGIAQLGALQVWMNARRDYDRAVDLYRAGLALGGSRPLPELFEAAGCRFDFSQAALEPLIETVMEEVSRLA